MKLSVSAALLALASLSAAQLQTLSEIPNCAVRKTTTTSTSIAWLIRGTETVRRLSPFPMQSRRFMHLLGSSLHHRHIMLYRESLLCSRSTKWVYCKQEE